MENTGLYFRIVKVDSLEGSCRIKLDSIGRNYKIVPIRGFNAPMGKDVPIIPSETYEIYHSSIGDAAAGIIYVLTDKNGRANKVMSQHEYNNYKDKQ